MGPFISGKCENIRGSQILMYNNFITTVTCLILLEIVSFLHALAYASKNIQRQGKVCFTQFCSTMSINVLLMTEYPVSKNVI